MNRTARLDFDPLARPAPIICASTASHWWPSAEERMATVTARVVERNPAEKKAKKPIAIPVGKGVGSGGYMQTHVVADWRQVIDDLKQATGHQQYVIAHLIGANRDSLKRWRNGHVKPSPESAAKLVALYRAKVGQQLPKGKE